MEAGGGQHIKETPVVRMVFLLSRNEIFDLHQGTSLGFVPPSYPLPVPETGQRNGLQVHWHWPGQEGLIHAAERTDTCLPSSVVLETFLQEILGTLSNFISPDAVA